MRNVLFRSRKGAYLLPLLVFVLILLGNLMGILALNHGRFIYTMDDPYIHLSLADHIRQGHYGVNAGEYSSPSSSIAWPFILALFSGYSWSEYVPFALNIIAAAATVMLFSRILLHILSPTAAERNKHGFIGVVAAVMIPSLNIVGLVFSGMEHSLQTLIAAMTVWGMIRLNDTSNLPRWLPWLLVVAPLIRYEAAAISLGGILLLMYHRRRLTALLVLLAIAALLGGFSAYLHSLGLPLLPASVIAKTMSQKSIFHSLFKRIYENITGGESAALIVCFGLLLWGWLSLPRARRMLAGCVVVSVGLSLLLGQFGSYYRYEIAILTAATLGVLYTYKDAFAGFLRGEYTSVKYIVAPVIAGGAVFIQYWTTVPTVAVASNNIYEQQYQMSRFVEEFYRQPVAVNDIGLVTYRSGGQYVLDLWGLSSYEALKARMSGAGASWIAELTQRHSIRVAMVYSPWFGALPAAWRPVGYLHLRGKRISVGDAKVTIYALDEEMAQTIPQLLTAFGKTLPPGVQLEMTSK